MKRLAGLWRDTWWLWIGFMLLDIAFAFIVGPPVGPFFLLLLPCLPVPFLYFAYNRYDEEGHEKPDLDS